MNKTIFYFLLFTFSLGMTSFVLCKEKPSKPASVEKTIDAADEIAKPANLQERAVFFSKGLGYATFSAASAWIIYYYLGKIFDPRKRKMLRLWWKNESYSKRCDELQKYLVPLVLLSADAGLIYANYKYETIQNAWRNFKQAFK